MARRPGAVRGAVKNASALLRAASLKGAATESSRSTRDMSAPDCCPRAKRSTASAGVNRMERQYVVNLMAASAGKRTAPRLARPPGQEPPENTRCGGYRAFVELPIVWLPFI